MPNWSDFQQHFMCNLNTECAGGEDELDCPYTGHCGQHRLTVGGRCYQYFSPGKTVGFFSNQTINICLVLCLCASRWNLDTQDRLCVQLLWMM